MNKHEVITSKSNLKIKELLSLYEKSKDRREKGVFVVEGWREINQCIEGGFSINSLFYSPSVQPREELPEGEYTIYEVSKEVYEKIAYRGSTEGIIALFKVKGQMSLSQLSFTHPPLLLILESVEKPGNLGAVLRTADAAGVDGIIICDPLTDIYNPNIIRASIGCVFTQNIIVCTSDKAIEWLKDRQIQILTAQLQNSKYYYEFDMKKGTAIIFGKESTGLSEKWREASDGGIMIPMNGKTDSLNVSISAAVLCYEAVRQRHIK